MRAEPAKALDVSGLRLKRGLSVIPAAAAVVIDGGRRRYFFNGSPRLLSLLLKLTSLLAEAHDLDGLAERCNASPAEVAGILRTLLARNLLESYEEISAQVYAQQHVEDFISRIYGSRDESAANTVLRNLAAGMAIIIAPARAAEIMAADLKEIGVGHVTVLDPDARSLDDLKLQAREARCIGIIIDEPAGGDRFLKIAEEFAHHNVPLLRGRATFQTIELGPLFYQDYTACPRCFCRAYDEFDGYVRGKTEAKPGDQAQLYILAALIAGEILAFIGGIGQPASARSLLRVPSGQYDVERYLMTPYSDCRTCGWPEVMNGRHTDRDLQAAEAVMEFEWLLEKAPFGSVAGLSDAGGEFRQSASMERIDTPRSYGSGHLDMLPRIALTDSEGTSRDEQPALADFLQQLPLPAGPDPGEGSSRVPPVEIYVSADSQPFGIPGSVFRYDAALREVTSVSLEPISVEEILVGSDLEPDGLTGVIILVSKREFAVSQRTFSHRDNLLHAGRYAARIRSVARANGAQVRFASRWDPRLGNALELRAGRDIIAAVAGLTLPIETVPSCR